MENRADKGWLRIQMSNAKTEVNGWQGWKKDTIRKEVQGRFSGESGRDSVLVHSEATGRWVITSRKK